MGLIFNIIQNNFLQICYACLPKIGHMFGVNLDKIKLVVSGGLGGSVGLQKSLYFYIKYVGLKGVSWEWAV